MLWISPGVAPIAFRMPISRYLLVTTMTRMLPMPNPDAMVVTILCDTGERYLSKMYDDDWMRENQLLPEARVTAAALLDDRPDGMPALVSVAPASS